MKRKEGKVVRGGQRDPALHIQPLSTASTSHFLESDIGYQLDGSMRNLPICCMTPKQNWDRFRFINADLLLDRKPRRSVSSHLCLFHGEINVCYSFLTGNSIWPVLLEFK